MAHYTKFVPEKDLFLAEAILDRYNTRLHCPACNKKWTTDGTTFRRDSGGRRGSLFYRKFPCKGKDIGCNANHPVSEFMSIALKDLGPATIASMRVELNLPDEPTLPPPVRKPYQGLDKSFNSTPIVQVPRTPEQSRKRHMANSPTRQTPDSKRRNMSAQKSASSEVNQLQIQLFMAQERLSILEAELRSKQKIIDRLMAMQGIF